MKVICYSCGRGENPENTLKGIEHCYSINPAWRIEMDVRITYDEKLVLFHDDNIERITGENGFISGLTLKEIQQLNAGYNFKSDGIFKYRTTPVRIPGLYEVFNEFPKAKLLLDVHSNNQRIIQKLIDLIDSEFSRGDFVIVSEYDEIVKKLKLLKPDWRYGVPAKEAKKMLYSSFLGLDKFFPIEMDLLMLPKNYYGINVLNKRVIKHAKTRDKPIWAWLYEGAEVRTVNSIEEIEQLRELGVQGVFTDCPEKMNQLLITEKKWNRIKRQV